MSDAPSGTVTFLFTDIAGSTQHWERDRAGMSAALARHDELLRSAIADHAGHVFKTVGDAFCAAFARASDSLDAALDAQLLLAAEVPDLRVRTALHTGQVEERDGDYFGPSVNRVARLLAVGHGGQVLLSEVTAGLVRDGLHDGVGLRDLGEHRLRDLSRPERVFQLRATGLAVDFPPLASLDARPHNLPLTATSFVGRQRELAALAELLPTVRLLALTGPGGTGKTRLSLQLAADQLPHYPDGAFFADLAPIADPERVPDAVAAALSLREEPGRTLTDTLLEALRARRLLLVLDNCEHVLEAAARLADAILRGAPAVRLVATSREPLAVPGEVVWPVPPLEVPDPRHATADTLRDVDAVRLFVDRAAAVKPGFVVTNANAPAIAELCARLDGSPLALELAAARVRAFSPEEIAKRLDERFRLLTGGSRVALPRHQTLRACLDWSYDLLSDTERRVLQRLGVFAGRFPLDAAEVVCVDEEIADSEVVDAVVNLEARSLVVAEPFGEGTEYRLLETIRAYAREQLAAGGDEAAARDRHLAWCLALAEAAEPHLTTAEAAEWLNLLERRHEDILAAFAWMSGSGRDLARIQLGVALGAHLWRYFIIRGFLRDGVTVLGKSVEVSSELPLTPAIAWIHYGLGAALGFRPQPNAAEAHLALAMEHFVELGNRLGESWALNDLGAMALVGGEIDLAAERFEASLAIKRDIATPADVAGSLNNIAEIERYRGNIGTAAAQLREALTLMPPEYEDAWLARGNSLANLGYVLIAESTLSEARRHLVEALCIGRSAGAMQLAILAIGGLGAVSAEAGFFVRAATLLGAGRAILADIGSRLDPVDDAVWVRGEVLTRTALGHREFEAHCTDARALGIENAALLALSEDVAAA